MIVATISMACAGAGGVSQIATPDSGSTAPIEASSFSALSAGWRTDFSRASVPGAEFTAGGPGKDGIPAIDEPKFVPVGEAAFVDDREPVLALELNGDAKAYPQQILVWHELVNDVVGGEPVAVSYCPLCNSSVVFDRTVQGQVLDFGVSGLLRNSDLVMFDRQTESWWQQITGEALVGTFTGARLTQLPASTIAFSDFRAAHPDGLVLSRDTGFKRDYGRNPYVGYDTPGTAPFLFDDEADGRLDPVERVVALTAGTDSVAYPFTSLADQPAVNDTVGAQAIVVFYRQGVVSSLDRSSIRDSKDVGEGVVYQRTVGSRTLTFEWRDDSFRDVETGSTWDVSGRAVSGPLAGETLPPVVHGNHFWFAWAAFRPETRIWQP